MNRLFLIIMTLLVATGAYSQDVKAPQLQLHSFKEVASANGMSNLLALFKKDWPMDADGNEECALVRVTFENMTTTDAKNVEYNFGSTSPVVLLEDRLAENEHEMWVFVTPSKNTFMEANLAKYGKSNKLSNIALKAKGVYDVVLRNEKTVTINVITKPMGLPVSLETGENAITNATFTDVSLGRHTLTFTNDGQVIRKEIEVTDANVSFEYDLRPTKRILFNTDPRGATLFINGEEKGRTPLELELPYDSYNVIAKLGYGEEDEMSITVNATSSDEITLEPIKKVTLDIFATYNGSKVNADLYIDEKLVGEGQPSYTQKLPIDKTYDMRMSYFGNAKKRKIKTYLGMDAEQEFIIPVRNRFRWPWQKEYDPAPFGISFGYVSKQMVIKGNGVKIKHSGMWGEEGKNKSLHGMQIGLHAQPCFSWGGGFYTGLFYELYLSSNDNLSSEYYNKLEEHVIYVPTHLYFRLPLARKVALSVHGGFGFSYVAYGALSDKDDKEVEEETDFYGKDGYYKRFNMASEIGVGVRIGSLQINAQYSKGINDHKMVDYDGFKSKQNRWSIGLSYVISTE